MLDKNFLTTVDNLLAEAKKSSFKKLKQDHIAAYRDKFNRVELNLGDQDNTTPTNERLVSFQLNDDPAFAALYFQYGRYLMISGTNEKKFAAQPAGGVMDQPAADSLERRLPPKYQCTDELLAGRGM